MMVRNLRTGESINAVIELVTANDFKVIQFDKVRFDKFDWNLQKEQAVYKLRLLTDDQIMGLISLIDHTDAAINAIEIALLEVSSENIGAGKTFDDIAGCLITFASRESFKSGHDGFVFLIPKTGLIQHYKNRYGFTYLPIKTIARPEGLMILDQAASRKLLRQYPE